MRRPKGFGAKVQTYFVAIDTRLPMTLRSVGLDRDYAHSLKIDPKVKVYKVRARTSLHAGALGMARKAPPCISEGNVVISE